MTTTSPEIELEQEISQLDEEISEEEARHAEAMAGLQRDRDEAIARRSHLVAGTDPETRREALQLIEVHGDPKRLTEKLVARACRDLADGCPELRRYAMALADYDRFIGQELLCSYIGPYVGSPKHGEVVVAIGLTESAREFAKKWRKLPLGENNEKATAAIRYLRGLREAGVV